MTRTGKIYQDHGHRLGGWCDHPHTKHGAYKCVELYLLTTANDKPFSIKWHEGMSAWVVSFKEAEKIRDKENS